MPFKKEKEENCHIFSDLLYVGKMREIEGAKEELMKETNDMYNWILGEKVIKPRQ